MLARKLYPVTLTGCGLLISGIACGSTYTITEIFVPGLTNTVAMAINRTGAIVGYGRPSSGDTVGFLNVNGTLTSISFPGAATTQANGINDGGDIVGTYSLPGDTGTHGFKYSGGTYTTIDAPAPARANTTTLVAINNSGQIAGNANDTATDGTDGFVYTAGSFAFLPVASGSIVQINGLSDSGEIVGTDGTFSTRNAIWGTANSYTELTGQPNGAAFIAVNNLGQVALAAAGSYILASPTDHNRSTFLQFPGAPGTTVHGLNDSGTVVGFYFESNSISHAFIGTITGPGPSCVVTGSAGPPRQISFTVQDVISGLKQIVVRNSTDLNSNVSIPAFTPGTTEPVVVTATAADSSKLAIPGIFATNNAGAGTNCVSQIAPGPPTWTGFAGKLDSNLSVARNQDGGLEVFGVGTDGGLWHKRDGSQFVWAKLGNVPEALTGDPVVFSDSTGALQILITSGSGTLWNIAQSEPNTWTASSWQSIQSGVKGNASALVDASGSADAFIRAPDNSVEWLTQNTTSSPVWSVRPSLGGVVISNPTAILDADQNVHVYGIGGDNGLWEAVITSQGTFVPWIGLGGALKGDPVVISSARSASGGSLYAFGRGTDDSLWMDSRVNAGNWSGFQNLGGILINNPRAITNSDGRVEVFVAGTDSGVWHKSQISADNPEWTDWSSLGGVIVGDVFPRLDSEEILEINVLGGYDRSFWQLKQSLPDTWQ